MGEVALVSSVITGCVLLAIGYLTEPPEDPTWLVRWLLQRSRVTLGGVVVGVSALEGILLERFWFEAVVVALRSGPIAVGTTIVMSALALGIGVTLARTFVEAQYSPFTTE